MFTKTEAERAGHRELRSVFLAGPELRIRAEFWARWLPIESPGQPGRLSSRSGSDWTWTCRWALGIETAGGCGATSATPSFVDSPNTNS